MDAWSTLDPAKAASFYAQEPHRVFYDLAPLKYTGWKEYAAGVPSLLADFTSLKLILGKDAVAHQRGNLAWATTTWHADSVTKDGSKEAMDGRWTVVWEKRGADWLVVHESPAWHQDVLAQREESFGTGQDAFEAWDSAKRNIRNQVP